MCTVSYVSWGNIKIITSNRDEQITRPALAPQWYVIGGKKLLFPKDPKAGGTWFAVDEKGNTAVLLNGAEEPHQPQQSYRRSRGLILLDIVSHRNPASFLQEIELDNIEPFTLILSTDQLHQLQWNGIKRTIVKLGDNKSYIWSSSTLYDEEAREKKQQLFSIFLSINKLPGKDDMYDFHAHPKEADLENGFIINRSNYLKTLSITQCVIEDGSFSLRYSDLTKEQKKPEIYSI